MDAYRDHAEECLQFAESMSSPEAKAVMVSMARAWRQLEQLHKQPGPVDSHAEASMEAG